MKALGMRLFLLSDGVTFAALLIACGALRWASPDWPKPFSPSPAILYATLMTLVLLASGFTMSWAVKAIRSADRKRTVQWLLATITGGLLFVALHLREWNHLIDVDKVTPWSNPWGVPLFGGVFFAVTGLHMLHVAAGVVYLGVLAAGTARGRFQSEDIETGGIYWYFVDIVWIFVFPLVYLTAVRS